MTYDARQALFSSFLNGGVNGTQAIQNDAMGRPIYIGYAQAGSAKEAARWQIRLITYDANGYITDVQFADGSEEFNKIWNSRVGYTYS